MRLNHIIVIVIVYLDWPEVVRSAKGIQRLMEK